jgi:integrase
MSCIYLRKLTWWYRTRINGKNLFLSLKTGERKEAEREQKKLDYKHEYLRKEKILRITINAALQYYMQQRLTLRPSTRTRYESLARILVERLADVREIQLLTVEHITEMARGMLDQGYAGKTVKEVMNLLAATLKLLHQSRLIDDIPIRKMPDVKVVPARPETLGAYSHDEIGVLRSWISEHDPDFLPYFLLLIYTGCRKGELLDLRIRDIDLADQLVRIRNEKTGRDAKSMYRTVEIHAEIMPVIRDLVAGKKADDLLLTTHMGRSKNWMLRCLEDACKILDIPWRRLHGLRHTFISSLLNAGVPLRAVMAMAGHTAPETTMRYSHISQDEMRGKIGKIGY